MTAPESMPSMTLFGHLREMRRRLIASLIALAIACLVTYHYADQLLQFLTAPLREILPGQPLVFIGLQEPFLVKLKIALWGGAVLSSPWWLYQFWAFVGPGLYRAERRQAAFLAGAATALLLVGAAFAYFLVMPLSFRFFLDQGGALLAPMPAVNQYLSLSLTFILAFGLVFQMPLGLVFCGRLGLVDAPMLRRGRRYGVLIIFIVAAVLTPPDAISQCFLAAPMLLLYELSIVLVGKGAARAGEPSADEERPVA
ncbi:MAG: twin-arginine translocase subunit TatC [Candidatus Adiutrix sp.]|jgi:sec-independent protein translocase protein TatC|nr:twin-arginine translocase subunit TatC [Candidatus Adiutrix sp.]